MVAVPLFDGMRPYQQVPFQYSLDIIHAPGGEPEHHAFLSDGKVNPQDEFLERLLAEIPPGACILTWNKTFEIGRLEELAAAFPGKRDAIHAVIRNIRDLMAPFREKSVYHWKFEGSYSIKVVLPALVPELSYDALPIRDGEMASSAWVRMIQSPDDAERSTIRKDLFRYCHLDTYAMVRILEKMKEYAGY
jgi:hypothetical protein